MARAHTRLAAFRLAFLGIMAFALCGCNLPMFSKKSSEPEYVKNPCLVLALPAAGPFSPIAAKIRSGAETARRELAKTGVQVALQNINTEAPDWLTKLSALPPTCAVVGGPLQDKAYAAARKSGILQQRAFFVFAPTLIQGDEGKQAWRFFPSPQDQVESLTNFATDQMNIRTYGSFYPADNYGRRMTEMLENNLKKRHIPLQKASYTPGAPATWQAAMRPLINPAPGPDGKTRTPATAFEALFLPDSWKNMDMITTGLLANGEDRLVLLGTTLWEQGLAGKQVPKAERYSLAVFPAAWNQAKAPAALKGKSNDFWSALGYDFVNFGAAVALAMRPDAARMTSRAKKAAPAIRAMAPINWDDSGVAHQRMYLFQVAPGGMTPVNIDRFRQTRTSISERAALRMQGFGNIDPDSGEAVPEAGPETVLRDKPEVREVSAPVSEAEPEPAPPAPAPRMAHPDPGPGVMSSTPRSSYKLSLPVKK